MQSNIVQVVICLNCDDYGLQLMKTPNLRKFEYCEQVQYCRLKGPDSQLKYAGVSTDTPAYFQICRVVALF